MALSVQLPPDASNSVAVHFSVNEYPGTLEQATNIFSKFGDIARLDTTLGSVTGLVFVTFFDVRVAQKVLQHFRSCAEPFQPAAYDFRAVSIATSVFAELPASFGGFQSFGEIAGVSICGEDMVVEFYDIRAAQQVTFSVPGSRPRKLSTNAPQQARASKQEAAPPTPAFSGADWVKESIGSHDTYAHHGADPEKVPMPHLGRGDSPKLVQPDMSSMQRPAPSGPVSQGPGKPVREKVRSQDLSKFDIIPEKIKSGEDQRTTVMVRNIPKACTKENFVELLTPCGLADRYTFFYMPFDKRRNIHCGFAFINFRTPQDVLKLFERMTASLWRAISQTVMIGSSAPAVSYARLQGQDQLMKHFSLSAVMHDSDARKRPVFCAKGGDASDFLIPEDYHLTNEQKEVSAAMALKRQNQPRYVSMPGMKDLDALRGGEDLSFDSDSLAFLMSSASGA
eukprot:gb/GFBE01039696.1/.p1 GENE.gb/GFBE01039696.1/~~gb/GFBE01039696.1/.p1  ORF type:complete len:452 (+),score=98.57 gb/GFBE01039696.1/:1-1356(+)